MCVCGVGGVGGGGAPEGVLAWTEVLFLSLIRIINHSVDVYSDPDSASIIYG